MPQIFHHSTNFLAKLSIFGAIFILLAAMWVLAEINRSSYNTGQFIERQQPVQFSHKHHSGDDGIDCRYCHTSVEVAATAGMPSTQTCMNCHTQIWADSPYWSRARELAHGPYHRVDGSRPAGYAYFNHSITRRKGVGCSTSTGDIDEMPAVYQAASLQMEWCPSAIATRKSSSGRRKRFSIWSAAGEHVRLKRSPRVANWSILSHKDAYTLTSCSTCHR